MVMVSSNFYLHDHAYKDQVQGFHNTILLFLHQNLCFLLMPELQEFLTRDYRYYLAP